MQLREDPRRRRKSLPALTVSRSADHLTNGLHSAERLAEEVQGWWEAPPMNLTRCTTEYRKVNAFGTRTLRSEGKHTRIPSGKALYNASPPRSGARRKGGWG